MGASVSLSFEFIAGVAAIGKHVPQPWEAKAHHFQQIDGLVAVLDVGGVDQDEHQKAAGVGEDMALAALDLLAGIITTNSAAFGGFDTLAVDHPGAGVRLAPLDLAQVHHQRGVDRLE